jgi:hypothetical protein
MGRAADPRREVGGGLTAGPHLTTANRKRKGRRGNWADGLLGGSRGPTARERE